MEKLLKKEIYSKKKRMINVFITYNIRELMYLYCNIKLFYINQRLIKINKKLNTSVGNIFLIKGYAFF